MDKATHRWRAKASEVLGVAEEMTDPQAKAEMIKIANGYEHLAELSAKDGVRNEQSEGPEPFQAQSDSPGASSKSTVTVDRELSEVEQHLADHRTHLRGMIVRGAPTQAAEDCLRALEQRILHLRTTRRRRNAES